MPCGGFYLSNASSSENNRKRKDKSKSESSKREENAVENEGDVGTDCSWRVWNDSKSPGKEIRLNVDQTKKRGHPD